jgi:hypothetical protein
MVSFNPKEVSEHVERMIDKESISCLNGSDLFLVDLEIVRVEEGQCRFSGRQKGML